MATVGTAAGPDPLDATQVSRSDAHHTRADAVTPPEWSRGRASSARGPAPPLTVSKSAHEAGVGVL